MRQISHVRACLALLLAAGLLCLLPLALSDGPGIPCVARGVVTFNGVPVDGAEVVSSANTSDVSYNGGNYGVDVRSGTPDQWIVATYQGHRAGVNLSRTPDSEGFVYADIAIVSGASSPTVGPTVSPGATQPAATATVGPSAASPSAAPAASGSPQPVGGEPLLGLAGLAVALFVTLAVRNRR